MKIPISWLREYTPVPDDPAGLKSFCDQLTMAGLEVEEVFDSPAGLSLYTKITPNRGDWASVYGTAREAAAAGSTALIPLPTVASEGAGDAGKIATVTLDDAIGCPRYAAKVIRGVKLGPSPQWLADRLAAAGMRAVSNVVDITNYVMLELGQPLHAFDLDTLPGGEIIVRRARAGEVLKTLDGVERALTTETLCICDREKPIAIAGIMGGGPTEVTEGTTDILLEAAHFDPGSVRRTAKRLPLATEASFRFERFVDPALAPIAAERAAQLLVQFAGGTVVPGLVDVYPAPKPPTRIMARVDRIRKLLGVAVERDAMIAGLERLGISVERSAGALDCVIPAFRPDLTIEDDIAEEVGRIALGYENLPATIPPLLSGRGADSARGLFTEKIRETLVRAGLQDVLTHSLTPPSATDLASADEAARAVRPRLALSADASCLRVSLLPNLIGIAARAHATGIRDIGIFEVGPVYLRADAGGYSEPLHVTGLVSGSAMPIAWSLKPETYPADFYYAKGIVEDLLTTLGIDDLAWAATGADAHRIAHPRRTATVSVGGESIGFVAELSEETVSRGDLPRRTYVFDLDGDALGRLSSAAQARFTPLARYPSVVRDIAPVFDQAVAYAAIKAAAIAVAGETLESMRLTDVYTGANLGAGRRSLTLRFTFRSSTGTLKDADVEAALTEIRAALAALGGELRG